MKKASLILYLFDLSATDLRSLAAEEAELRQLGVPYIKIGNKVDKARPELLRALEGQDFILISASQKTNLQTLKDKVLSKIHISEVGQGDVLVTNLRHYQKLLETRESLLRVLSGLATGVTGDFLAMDIRQALYHLGEITGEITTEDLLDNIFSKFCIGK